MAVVVKCFRLVVRYDIDPTHGTAFESEEIYEKAESAAWDLALAKQSRNYMGHTLTRESREVVSSDGYQSVMDIPD